MQQYTPEPAAKGADIPLSLIVISGIGVWVLIFGGLLAYGALSPCSFVKKLIGTDTFVKLKDPSQREPPCDPGVDENCKAYPLGTSDGCRTFLRCTAGGGAGC